MSDKGGDINAEPPPDPNPPPVPLTYRGEADPLYARRVRLGITSGVTTLICAAGGLAALVAPLAAEPLGWFGIRRNLSGAGCLLAFVLAGIGLRGSLDGVRNKLPARALLMTGVALNTLVLLNLFLPILLIAVLT